MAPKQGKPVSIKENTIKLTKKKKQVLISFPNVLVGIISCLFGLITPPFLHRLIVDEELELSFFNAQRQPDYKSVLKKDADVKLEININLLEEKLKLQNKQEQQQRNLQLKKFTKNRCTNRVLNAFLHDDPVRGYHVICFKANSEQSNDNDSSLLSSVNVTFYKDGVKNPKASSIPILENDQDLSSISWDILKKLFIDNLELSSMDQLHQPWSVFTKTGKRIMLETDIESSKNPKERSVTKFLSYGIVLVYQGGQFIWPGVRVGFERRIAVDDSPNDNNKKKASGIESKKNVTLETLSLNPLVLSVKGFLSYDECDYIQNKATPTMQYSGVVLMDKDAGRPASDFRTSQTTFLSAVSDPLLTTLDDRTASLVRIPRNHQEPLQVLKYDINERYLSHTDYFPPELYKNDQNTLNLIQNGLKNRMITVFWYLSTVEDGGETVFPKFNGRMELSNADCSGGLLVQPEKGKVIIFYSLKTSGEVDAQSLHGACPVKQGLKWAANKWVWNHPMSYVN